MSASPDTIDRAFDWASWLDAPVATDWYDLTRVLDADVERVPGFPAPEIYLVRSIAAAERANVTEVRMVCHVGTHVDAPRHFFDEGPSAEEIPLGRLTGQGVVWRLHPQPLGEISVTHLEGARPRVRPGDAVLLHTGWAERWGTPDYPRNPSLTPEAAQWLVDAGVRMLAVDFATPDLAHEARQPDFDWPVHRILLGQGVLICEHLAAVPELDGRRVETIFAGLPVRSADGAPARVLARVLQDAT